MYKKGESSEELPNFQCVFIKIYNYSFVILIIEEKQKKIKPFIGVHLTSYKI